MKINRLILLFVLFVGFSKINSQNYIPYYNLVNEAEYQMYIGKNDLAFGLFTKAINMKGITPKARDWYFLGKLYLERNNKNAATDCFKKISNSPDGQFSYWATRQQSYFLNYYKDIEFKTLVSESEEKEKRHYASYQFMQDSLDAYLKEDQRLRKIFADSIEPWYDKGNPIYDSFLLQMDTCDRINQVKFLSFIKGYGYPGIYAIGSDGAGTILQHINYGLYPQYKEVLYDLLVKGQLEPFFYASMVDRAVCIYEGRSLCTSTAGCTVEWRTMLENRESIGLTKYFKDPGTRVFIQRQLLTPQ